MEEIIVSTIEKTLVGGAFIYLLHYFVNKFNNSLISISDSMVKVTEVLLRMDMRFEQIEKRLEKLEERR